MGLRNTEVAELKDYKNLKVKTLVFHIFPVTNQILMTLSEKFIVQYSEQNSLNTVRKYV